MDWYILAYTKGELNQRFQQVLRGSMDSGMYSKEENILVPPLPLMSKGENDFEDLGLAIKSKGGDYCHYDSGLAL